VSFNTIAVAALAVTAFLAPVGSTQLGDPGYEISAPQIVATGMPFGFCLTAPPESTVVLLVGTQPGVTPTKFGELGLALPVAFIFIFPMPLSGQFCFPPDRSVPCSQDLVGVTMYMQLIAIGPEAGQHGISNRADIEILDAAACTPGGLVTYTQGAWGGTCSGNNPACLLQANFDTVFPNGLILGDPDGIDGDSEFALLLTSSDAVSSQAREAADEG